MNDAVLKYFDPKKRMQKKKKEKRKEGKWGCSGEKGIRAVKEGTREVGRGPTLYL